MHHLNHLNVPPEIRKQLNCIHEYAPVKARENQRGRKYENGNKGSYNERFNIAVKLHFLLVPDKHHVRQARLDELRRTITSHGTLNVSDSRS